MNPNLIYFLMMRNYQTVKFLGQTFVKSREDIFRITQPDRKTKRKYNDRKS
ncbi:hypothetical protein LEP1GSC016_2474 [Leptospira borgpetersenii serovar Hardjo-bovis str. Sponselee]|uniref:Uncharacterized protein n=4 Tax=Leptospira borgpetersenii TaxID=174 RepID=M3F9F5_LEPBO|nr:hypothetical protein LEP1GSC128_3068 [Leptospira borgpetersenii str. 200801926]EKQ91919.1 hypothetical protein LEP1GSC101_3356 [Leptospira borgpetersenii str. UI 09149]EMF98517.1 hypothetical protein LEP1GSC123_4398 [Leptospira borgpetersenii str. 200701203]EMJ79662.1 hypothetical protein LEP1GSC016_2474 [Leptospira borgpetersenii serovar Hardjo-bovis str. Sponselee]EMK08327.1 hypothetical protein LEP1GSC066_1283 [Leptospira sp. serovar Kenya str. Sh9]EMN56786.1 hypothetical protein LEP1GSC